MNSLLTFATKSVENIKPVGNVSGNASSDVQGIIIGIINGILGIVGLVAVVMVIMGGISYMTSAGDASKVKKGKDTILYGIIGLVIIGLAFAIVNFVIVNVIGNNNK